MEVVRSKGAKVAKVANFFRITPGLFYTNGRRKPVTTKAIGPKGVTCCNDHPVTAL